jgi:hypothetical protein
MAFTKILSPGIDTTGSYTIQELNAIGVVTASAFSGDGSGLSGIDATSLKDVDGNVKIQAGGGGIVVTGVSTFQNNISGTTGTFSGNVSIAGTLTYEDVINVDSIGIITARSGIRVTGVGASVGIGTDDPTEKLHVIGNILASGNITAFSDIKLKDNIEVIPNALDKVVQIRGVTFDRVDEEVPRQSGVIAQEVEKVLPEVVITNKDGIKSVAYGNLVGLLIESIKELKVEVNELKERLEE